MAASEVKTRFAPSPSGGLHLGGARTALFNHLYARHHGGEMLIRIEDTDEARSREGAAASVLVDLEWLGLYGPGSPEPYRQSDRGGIYAEYFRSLEASGRAYPCFCTAEELAAERERQRGAGRAPRYSGRCARLSATEVARLRREGRPEALRFRVEAERTLTFDDLLRGPQKASGADIGDFIIRRADGTPAFLFGNAVDDALTGVSHVLRGEDHLANTPRQIMVLEALGLDPPRYGHLPLIVDSQGQPLSKRRGDVGLAELRERGYLPGAVNNYLVRLGHAGLDDEVYDLEELAERFTPARLSRSAATLDFNQLDRWQRLAVDASSAAELVARGGEELSRLVPSSERERFVEVVRPNVTFARELLEWARIAFDSDHHPDAAEGHVAGDVDPKLFEAALEAYDAGHRDLDGLAAALRDELGVRGAALYKPLRRALTGRDKGPELRGLLRIMPAPVVRRRLQGAASATGDVAERTPARR